jgi:hypothetical protein
MGARHSNQLSIDIHELTQDEQENENRRRYPNQVPGKNDADSEFSLLYFLTLTKTHPKIKKRFEVNYSYKTPNRWFLCPYNNTMEQLRSWWK